jgi:hypothetical protein
MASIIISSITDSNRLRRIKLSDLLPTMGFPPELVASTEDAVSEFLCAICRELPEGPMVTPCHHVFCASCLGA